MNVNLAGIVELDARVAGKLPVPRDYIVEAFQRIESGEIDVERYLDGAPSLEGVYEVALGLYKESIGS